MKQLNKDAAKTFNRIIALMGTDSYVKIDNTDGVFMPLSFELLSEIDFNGVAAKYYAMAHYYEQSGDLVPDPDMTFIQLVKSPEIIWPASITNSFGHRDSLYKSEGKWVIATKEQADQTSFANMWLKNIKYQQFQ